MSTKVQKNRRLLRDDINTSLTKRKWQIVEESVDLDIVEH